MSGGSYEYAYRDLEEGELSRKVLVNLDAALTDLARIAAAPVVDAYETEERVSDKGQRYRVGVRRDVTDRERIETEMAIGALVIRLTTFAHLVRSVSAACRDMAPLFKELEWAASGDTSTCTVQEWAREWARKRLEQP